MDIFWLTAVVDEVCGTVAGSSVNKIYQPTAETLIFKLWTGRSTVRLLVSVDSRFGRLHLTEKEYPNPFTPPRFCQLLRARLSTICRIEQLGDDRIVAFTVTGREGDYRLIAELTGRFGNLILIDHQGRIVDALHRVQKNEGHRAILPGITYCLPEQQARVDLKQEVPRVPGSVQTAQEFKGWLLDQVRPMSVQQAAALAREFSQGTSATAILARFRQKLVKRQHAPRMVEESTGPALRLFEGECDETVVQRFETASAALDDYYYARQFTAGQIGEGRDIAIVVARALKKLHKRHDNISKEQQKTETFEQRRAIGNLLLANLHRIKRGMDVVDVVDYTTDPPQTITVDLDPRLTPQENAQRYFARYKKEKRGVDHVARRLKETETEIAWLEEIELSIAEAKTPDALEEVRNALSDAGLIRTRETPATRQKKKAGPVLRRTISPSGLTILWGRNPRSNDEISVRHTRAEDLWFHAHNQPGCHLVLQRGDRKGPLPEEDIYFAATLAAGYSRGQNDHKVEVMVTEGKQVKKPKGVPPGLVTVKQYRTLTVPPRRMEENADK